ncbi:MAG: O-linked N-acetylglucosamine transferase, SPINDLY family protein, partial [Cyanobacteria bacterium J007]
MIDSSLLQQARQLGSEGKYQQAAYLYEQAIEVQPEVKTYYWYLGLMLLLQGREEEATTTWLFATLEGTPKQIEEWTRELVEILDREAKLLANNENSQALAWLVRGHIRELQPTNLDNLLSLITLSVNLDKFSGQELIEWGIVELLRDGSLEKVDNKKLLNTLRSILKNPPVVDPIIDFTQASLAYVENPSSFINKILPDLIELAYSLRQTYLATALLEICHQADPSKTEILRHLASLYQTGVNYIRGIEVAQECYESSQNLPDKIFANHLRLRGFLSAGTYWTEAYHALEEQALLLWDLVNNYPSAELPHATIARLTSSVYFFPYLKDLPTENRKIFNS